MLLVDVIEKPARLTQSTFASSSSSRPFEPQFSGPSSVAPASPNLEIAARAALDSCAGRTLSVPEWGRARTKLLEFVTIIAKWDQAAKNSSKELGNVDAICQQER